MHTVKASFSASSSFRQVLKVSGSAILLLTSISVFAQLSDEDLRLPISLDAESTNYDGKSSMLMFKGLRLSQGNIGIEADEGRATKLDFEDSLWQFSGNVVLDTENGHIECDAADLSFADHQLVSAIITGVPATFEMKRPESDETTYAEANRLDYNFKLGVVEFSGNATITEGGNQISSNYLVYNIAEQRIDAQSAGTDGDRVKIIYTPSPVETPNPKANPSAENPGQPLTDESNSPDERMASDDSEEANAAEPEHANGVEDSESTETSPQ